MFDMPTPPIDRHRSESNIYECPVIVKKDQIQDHKEHLKLIMETYKTIQMTRHNINNGEIMYYEKSDAQGKLRIG